MSVCAWEQTYLAIEKMVIHLSEMQAHWTLGTGRMELGEEGKERKAELSPWTLKRGGSSHLHLKWREVKRGSCDSNSESLP